MDQYQEYYKSLCTHKVDGEDARRLDTNKKLFCPICGETRFKKKITTPEV